MIRARVEDRAVLVEAVRQCNAVVDPRKIAAWVMAEAERWSPGTGWAVTARGVTGRTSILAERNVPSTLEAAVIAIGDCALVQGDDVAVADLALDSRMSGATGSALAIPLVSRGEVVGALVGIDPHPSAESPSLGPADLMAALRTLLEPPAFALHNAFALQRAEALSVTDDLTGLYNVRFLNQSLRREAKRASRSGRPLSLLFVDLDNFKQVNDRHGHMVGSKVLIEVAATIRGSARETDVVARFGGDEFSLVLPETSRDGALAVATRLRHRLATSRFLAAEGLSVVVTASVGVATLPEMAASAEELLRAADRAMYLVKSTGKDGIRVAEDQAPVVPPPTASKE